MTKIFLSISQELYLVWLWFLVHMCKNEENESPAIFIFSKFWFFSFLGGGKKWPIIISIFHTLYLKKCRSYHQDLCYTVVKWWYLRVFFFFKKYNIVNIKILIIFLIHFKSFLNKWWFFKFINKSQTEILRHAPTFSACVWFFLNWHVFVCVSVT